MPTRAMPRFPVLWGVDFSSAPSRRKPITVAGGRRQGGRLELQGIEALPDLAAFEARLATPGPWLGAFDFPFGLPRAFVDALSLGATLAAVVAEVHRRCPTRKAFQALIDDFGNQRPAGQRLPHRACDTAEPGVSSSSPLQTRYVPVGFMFYEGVRRLLEAGLALPGLHDGDARRVALEGYPGLLAFELIGRRSYKNADDGDRRAARAEILDGLRRGRTRLGLKLSCPRALEASLLDDASGDRLDAVLCLVQAAWARARKRWSKNCGGAAPRGWRFARWWTPGARPSRPANACCTG